MDMDDQRDAPPASTTPLARRTFLGRSAAAGAATVAVPLALSACGGGDEATDETTGGDEYEPGSASLKHELAPEIEGINYPEDYVGPRARELQPFGDGEREFTILSQIDPGMDLETNSYSTHLEETTGVSAKYVTVPAGEDGKTKVNAIVAGGDLPDAMMVGQDIFTLSEISIYGQQGLFLPLDKLIDENAPHILDMFSSFPDMRPQYSSPDGRLYAVPSMNDCYHCKAANVRTWINADWLEAVGAEVPQTLEEYEAVMEAFRDWSGRPQGSALTTASAETMLQLMQFFMGSFLEMPDLHLRRAGDTIEWLHRDPAFREGMIWIQEQFAKGNLDRGILSNTAEQYQKLGDAADGPLFGMAYGYSTFHFAAAADPSDPQDVSRVMKIMPPLEGPAGVRSCQWDHFSYGYPNFVITPQCPDPVQMIRWADHQFELGLTISLTRGEQGTDWDWADQGLQGIDGQQAVYQILDPGTELTNRVWREWGPLYKSMSQRHSEAVPENSPSIEPILYAGTSINEPFATPEEIGVPPLIHDMEQSAQVGEIITNLEDHVKQLMADVATGRADAGEDAAWNAYLDGAEAMGVDTYLSISQAAYDEQYG
ncbi:hypothetical protein GCM10009626_10230 [Brachybacterium sacelli]